MKTIGIPEALHGAQADADGLGHHAARPMGALPGLRVLSRSKPSAPLLGETLLPAPHRRAADFSLAGDIDNRQLGRRQKDDPSPQDMLLRAVAISDDGGQARAVVGSNNDVDGLCHAPKIAWISPQVNPLISSMH